MQVINILKGLTLKVIKSLSERKSLTGHVYTCDGKMPEYYADMKHNAYWHRGNIGITSMHLFSTH